jgi:hypothetical protein
MPDRNVFLSALVLHLKGTSGFKKHVHYGLQPLLLRQNGETFSYFIFRERRKRNMWIGRRNLGLILE